MGFDLYIGQEQVRISNYHWWNEYINLVAQLGDFPQILNHDYIEGEYRLKHRGITPLVGSVNELKKEVLELQKIKLPEFAEDITRSLLEACDLAIKNKKNISLTMEQ